MPITISGDTSKQVVINGDTTKSTSMGVGASSSGSGGSGGGLPLTNMTNWYKADAITGIANGGRVETWVDSSGNNKPLVKFFPYYNPNFVGAVYAASVAGLNGMPACYFPRFDSTPLFAVNSGAPSGSAARSVYIACTTSMNPSSHQGYPVSWGTATYNTSSGGADYSFAEMYSISISNDPYSQYREAKSSGSTSSKRQIAAGANPDTSVIMSHSVPNGGTIASNDFFLNGVAATGAAQGTATTLATPSNPTILVGYGMTNYVAEIMIYSVEHTASERNAVTAYLASKYGITI